MCSKDFKKGTMLVGGWFYLMSILLWNVSCELSADEVDNLVQLYHMTINMSLSLSRSDKALLSTWAEDHVIKQVNVTTKFRLQMRRHKEFNFQRTNMDDKWNECFDFYSNKVERTEELYYEEEALCLKNCNEDGKKKKLAVDQVEKEIKKWRKSFKYLSHLCDVDNARVNENAKACLVDYIEKDNYNAILQRLIVLKLEAMGELLLQLNSAIENLEDCLKTVLSGYLDRVRTVMKILNRCYHGKTTE